MFDITDHRVALSPFMANPTSEHFSRRKFDSNFKRLSDQRQTLIGILNHKILQRQTRLNGSLSIIAVPRWSTKQDHHAVADIFIDETTESMHLGRQP